MCRQARCSEACIKRRFTFLNSRAVVLAGCFGRWFRRVSIRLFALINLHHYFLWSSRFLLRGQKFFCKNTGHKTDQPLDSVKFQLQLRTFTGFSTWLRKMEPKAEAISVMYLFITLIAVYRIVLQLLFVLMAS